MIVLHSFSSIPISLILLNIYSWLTLSNADLRSMNNVHGYLSLVLSPLLIFTLIYSVILRIFISVPIYGTKPVCSTVILFSLVISFHSLFFSIVSNNLYIGDVFVIGLAMSNICHSVSVLAINSYSSLFSSYISSSLSLIQKLKYSFNL